MLILLLLILLLLILLLLILLFLFFLLFQHFFSDVEVVLRVLVVRILFQDFFIAFDGVLDLSRHQLCVALIIFCVFPYFRPFDLFE